MKNKSSKNFSIKFLAVFIFIVSLGFTFIESGGGGGKARKPSLKAGDSYRMFINNLNIPLSRSGVIGDVLIDGSDGGRLNNIVFLFSSGFFMSGKTGNTMWANAVATASRVEDYVTGLVGQPNDPRSQLYVLRADQPDFGDDWKDWKDAVALGAKFYDGNGDGIYDPVDLNGNGVWDPDEDRPDMLGDETVWCVYNDGVPTALRRFNDVEPQGIEVRQTVFGYASAGLLGNILFVRYELLNTGTKADVLDSVYFGVWADPDLGDYTSDLVGCDTLLDAGYVYNDGPDLEFGPNPPCFLIDFFQGPVAFIPGETFEDANGNGIFDPGETALTTAYNVKGLVRGIDTIPGAKTLGLSSFVHYIQSHPTQGDPSNRLEARNYMLGFDKIGASIDPCTWPFGSVVGGTDCNAVNKKFMYSGDPVSKVGWINITPVDQRQMSNTGPFQLKKGEELTITAAYIVGRSNSALASVTQAKKISEFAQTIYSNNFRSPRTPPAVNVQVETSDDFIDLIWNTQRQVTFTDSSYNIFFEGYKVFAYRTPSTAEVVSNIENRKLIATYDLDNFIENIYVQEDNGAIVNEFPVSDTTKLNYNLYADPSTGKIRLRLTRDPFTGGPLIKGKPYYFSVVAYGVNYSVLLHRGGGSFGDPGDYLIDPDAIVGTTENIQTITKVVVGEDVYSPPTPVVDANQTSGAASGKVGFDVVNKENLTGHNYEISFMIDSVSQLYKPFWRLTNTTTGAVLIDSSKTYTYGSGEIAGTSVQGFIPRVQDITPTIGTATYSVSAADRWFKAFDAASGTGVFYVSNDLPQSKSTELPGLSQLGKVLKADQLKKVELRFEPGKAYRYLNGYKGTGLGVRTNITYAAAVTASDTAGKGVVGKLGEGFVDVPFSAYIVDSAKGIPEQRLAVGFVERASNLLGNPDGLWDPRDSLKLSMEYILIFNSEYDETGSQKFLTGGDFSTPTGTETVWAELKGFTIPATAVGITDEQRKIAASAYLNTLYAVGLQKKTSASTWNTGEKLVIPVSIYPYTPADVYNFNTKAGGALTADEKKALFDRVNVYPNPLFAFNPATSFETGSSLRPDEPFVTFSNLPRDITIKVYSLSGTLLRTLSTADKSGPDSPFLRWDLQNESGLRVASGMYLAIVSSPEFGEKLLKFAIIMPQKQIQRF